MTDQAPTATPAVVLDWLARAETGGVHVLDRDGMTFRPWSRVHADAARVADHLAEHGVVAGDRIGVRGENAYEWLVLDVALLRLGACPVAIPVPDFQGRSNEEVADTYGIRLMFASRGARSPGDGSAPIESVLDLDPLPPLRPPGAPAGAQLPPGAGHFSVAFSSGTAGRVKCLLMSWPGVARLVDAALEAYDLGPDDRILVALPLSTFQQRYLCYLAIRRACEIVLTTAARYFAALERARPTFVLGPPSFYEFAYHRFANASGLHRWPRLAAAKAARVLPARLRAAVRRREFHRYHDMFGNRMRLMLVGSAPVGRELLEFFHTAGFPLYQIYGMTETGYLTWNRPGANRIGSVGRETYPGTVTLAEDGEVLVRHHWHICAGYEGEAPGDVAAVFRGDDVVATGDLGRFEDGYLYLIGRKKHLVVTSGGEKLQLEDLEADLAKASGVNRVALLTAPDRPGLALVAWYRGEGAAVRTALRARVQLCNRRLGAGPRIDRVALVEGDLDASSPLLNRNLKVDRRAVRDATERLLEPVDW